MECSRLFPPYPRLNVIISHFFVVTVLFFLLALPVARMSSKAKVKVSDTDVAQFVSVTGASTRDAKKFIEKHKRLDIAMDAYYNDPTALATTTSSIKKPADLNPSTSKLGALFDKYKDPDATDITIDGTLKWCEDLGVNPEDVVLLAIAFELKSPAMCEWTKKGWTDGWKSLGTDTIAGMRTIIPTLRNKLSSDPAYFQKVYNFTFDFGLAPGQRSLPMETAQGFWAILIPQGLKGGALAHVSSADDDEDTDMEVEEGWQEEYTEWWFEFLNQKGTKGVSKDTWTMFLDFIRSIDAKFSTFDVDSAWPSTIDDFVEWAKERVPKS